MRRFRLLLPIAALTCAATLVFATADIKQLGFDSARVEDCLFGALRGWYSSPGVPQAVRVLPDADKAVAVKTLGLFARSFFASADFTKRYDEVRKSSKPKRSFGLPKLSLDPKAIAQKAVDKAVGKPAPAGELSKDPNAQIKKRLTDFLAVTEDVDYAAETSAGNRNGQFLNDDYESKPTEWKMCYRAGKATGEAIRKVAEDWLADLP